MKIKIYPSKAEGSVLAPPSKSYAHRLLIAAGIAGSGRVYPIADSEDMGATRDCIENMKKGIAIFPCRESGSTLRFFIPPALALTGGGIFTGTERLIERGIGLYEEMLAPRGVTFTKGPDKIEIRGSLEAGDYCLRGDVSSQFVTGLLFALPLAKGDSTITVLPPIESRAYIDITLEVLKDFGIAVEEIAEGTFAVKGNQTYRGHDAEVPGDWSNGAFLHAFSELSGGALEVKGLDPKSAQGDKKCVEYFRRIKEGNITFENPIDISDCPDLGPILFAMAGAYGGGYFTGIRRLRIKESDRAAVMVEELSKFGVHCEMGENTMYVEGGIKAPCEVLSGHNDHRIVMSMAVLASVTGGVIDGCEAVRKSYPDFFDVIRGLGIQTEEIR